MPRLKDIPVGESVILLAYAKAGDGKSDFLGSTGDRTVVYDLENRKGTWQKSEFRKRRGNWNPEIITITEEPIPTGGAKALDEITASIRKLDVSLYDTICIDGATSLKRFAFNKGIENNGTDTKSKAIAKRVGMPDSIPLVVTDVRDLTAEMQLISKFLYILIENCREAKKNLIVTAHERVQFEKREKKDMMEPAKEHIYSITPGFTGQTFPDEIPGIFDLVWHFETEGIENNIKYLARTSGDSVVMAKSSVGSNWPVKYYNPNFLDIIKKVKEG